MVQDKSFYYYGSLYHKLIDGKLAEACRKIVARIPPGSKVLDIGCGTGQLCRMLCEEKNCEVTGIDLSAFADHAFDYAVMLVFIHELVPDQQKKVLSEAFRVARKVIIVDSVSPLPDNLGKVAIYFAETVFGHDHFPQFKRFLKAGGIRGILKESGLPATVKHSEIFWRNSRELVEAELIREG